MKIILLGTTWPFRPGGIATFNERLARALQESGHEVIIYTFSLQYPSFLFPGKTQYSDDPAPKGLDIHIKVNSVNPFNWIKIGLEIARLKPDWLLLRFWIPLMAPVLGTIARLAKKNKHTRIIALTDNILPHEKRIGDILLTRYFVKSVDGFVTMSKQVMSDLGKLCKNTPVAYSPHPLYDNFGPLIPRQTACQNLQLDPAYQYLLFFGFIREYKGLDWLLNAFADQRMRQFKLKLLVAGEYYTSAQPYLDIIREKGLEEMVILRTGFIRDQDVASYFCASDLVVQPYKSATQSGVTQIAYHFEKPMVVTNVGGLSETVKHGLVGYSVNPEPSAIADAIIDFYLYSREKEMIKHLKEEKKNFTWDKMIETFEKIDKEILKKK